MSPPPEDSLLAAGGESGPSSPDGNEFSSAERELLLRLAHQAIASAIEHSALSLSPPSPHLAEPRGVFTTLYSRGNLRGCIGHVFPVISLYRAVVETARAAAFDDTRFGPLALEELSQLEVSLSVLSPLRPIAPGRNRDRPSWSADLPRRAARPAAAPSADRARLGPGYFSRTGLPQSRLAEECVADGRRDEGFTAEVFGRPGAAANRGLQGTRWRSPGQQIRGGFRLPESFQTIALRQESIPDRRPRRHRPDEHLPGQRRSCRSR